MQAMFKKFHHLPFEEWKKIIEVSIRGEFLREATHLEYFLFKVIAYCDRHNESVTRRFNRKILWDKFNWAKTDLKKYYSELFTELEPLFKEVQDLIPVRDHLAHYLMKFDETQDKSYVDLMEIQYSASNNQNIVQPITYTIDNLDIALSNFKRVNRQVIFLWDKVLRDYVNRNDGETSNPK
jgi:hypothetical protein